MNWHNIADYKERFKPFTIDIGGRGIGKTYSALRFMLDQGEPFLYLRTTEAQIDECVDDFGNPFKRLNMDTGADVRMIRQKRHAFIVRGEGDALKRIGYVAALSTFHNLRGVDLSDVRYVLYDEFIEATPARFDQFRALINMYETINRNRDIMGETPLVCIMLSNAQSLNSPILAGLDLIGEIERMIARDQRVLSTESALVIMPRSDVSEAKAKTGIYSAIKNSAVYRENIENAFANDSFYNVKKRSLVEYTPLCAVDGLYIYRHKSALEYYVCRSRSECRSFSLKDERVLFMRTYGTMLLEADAFGKIYYCDYTAKMAFGKIIY